MSRSAWQKLEHLLYQKIKERKWQSENFLICVSGGRDSMALLWALARVLPAEQIQVFHFHHGPGSLLAMRDRYLRLVQKECENLKIKFIYKKSEKALAGEQQMRDARKQAVLSVKGSQIVVMAHHAQDLLETRLIRLIRGTGAQGLMAMRDWNGQVFRPWLEVSRPEIDEYVKLQKINFIEDPSNRDPVWMRNWLRHQWLAQLESYRPGAVGRLQKSLEIISNSLSSLDIISSNTLGLDGDGIQRHIYISLAPSEQTRVLALLFLKKNIRDFKASQIFEIRKQLDKSANELILKFKFVHVHANAKRIWLEIVSAKV